MPCDLFEAMLDPDQIIDGTLIVDLFSEMSISYSLSLQLISKMFAINLYQEAAIFLDGEKPEIW